ncbi:MAG: adenosine kinase, partial [Rickettsiales bacterium]|nr:adenosine kinase [Rickettsiales bacterium]
MIFKDIIFLGKFMKKILGMGNAVLDVLVKTSDEYLEKNNLSKGTMIIVEEAESKKLLEKIVAIKKDSGGSIANTMV